MLCGWAGNCRPRGKWWQPTAGWMTYSHVCLFVCLFVRALTGKQLEILTPNLVNVYSKAVARHALIQRSKGQGHMVTKTLTVARLPVICAATAYAGVGAHVDSTAYVFLLLQYNTAWNSHNNLPCSLISSRKSSLIRDCLQEGGVHVSWVQSTLLKDTVLLISGTVKVAHMSTAPFEITWLRVELKWKSPP